MPPSAAPSGDAVEVVLRAAAPVDAAGAAVRAAALHAGLQPDRATRLRATVEELLREARDRESVDGSGDLEVATWVDGDRLVVEMADRRLPIAPGGGRRLPSRRLAALGFVDHLHIASRGSLGNVARVEVSLEDPDPVAFGGEVLPPDATRVGDDDAAALQIRELRDEDVPGVVRCVYRCYGYSYLDPDMYRPSTIRARVRAGRLRSVVAVEPGGDVVGHCALTFGRTGDPVPEAGKLVVDPRYRGHHLAERLAEVRLGVARELQLPGIWAECVTNHPYSQREFAAFGGVETGLLMGVTPAAVTMEGLPNDGGGRHSLMAMWAAVDGTPPSRVNLPRRHEPLIAAMSIRSGQERTFDTTVVAPTCPHTKMSASVDVVAGDGWIRIEEVGTDLLARVAHELDAMSVDDLASVQLDVPLSDPGAAWAIEGLESLGVFFGAWFPGYLGAEHGDVLRLQRVADRPLALDVHCAGPDGESVRDAVMNEWHRVHRGAL